jgi:chromosome segregation ATPase
VRFISLKINARHANGWESPTLVFGRRTTSLFARNGSGKTPVVQSIAFCLGTDVTFREDICNNCKSATLTIEIDGRQIEIERDFSDKRFVVRAQGTSRQFEGEAEFSRAFFQEIGMEIPSLVSASKKSTMPYVSTVLPIFFMRQDGGYLGAYTPSRVAFIQDQFVEMLRFVFGYPPKRSYDVQKSLLQQKGQLDLAQRRVVYQQQIVARLAEDIDDSPDVQRSLKQSSAELTQQIDELRVAANKQGAASNVLVEMLSAKDEQIKKTRRVRSELQARIDGIDGIRAEIEGEIKTLSLNEESRRVFMAFEDICANPDCGLFLTSQETYGKNLLYLKDQIKDLENNVQRAEVQIASLDESILSQESERNMLRERIRQLSKDDDSAAVITAVQNLTRELMNVEQKLIGIEKLHEEKKKYVRLDEERFRIQDSIAAMTRAGRSDLGFNALRGELEKLTAKWMDILATPNVSRQVSIEPDFRYKFGTEYLDIFTGSGRARLVLAIHGAIFEKYLEVETRPFRFLILDTPKQHELESPDLARYLDALQQLCEVRNSQIVVSSTEYRHPIGVQDAEWLPSYAFPEKPMYLGAPRRN